MRVCITAYKKVHLVKWWCAWNSVISLADSQHTYTFIVSKLAYFVDNNCRCIKEWCLPWCYPPREASNTLESFWTTHRKKTILNFFFSGICWLLKEPLFPLVPLGYCHPCFPFNIDCGWLENSLIRFPFKFIYRSSETSRVLLSVIYNFRTLKTFPYTHKLFLYNSH